MFARRDGPAVRALELGLLAVVREDYVVVLRTDP